MVGVFVRIKQSLTGARHEPQAPECALNQFHLYKGIYICVGAKYMYRCGASMRRGHMKLQKHS